MADTTKFGRGAQFGHRISPVGDGADTSHCGQCEAMLADLLEGSLSPEQQAFFEVHIAGCGPCMDMLADAKRGAAWLEMLRDPRPEPPAELLERILVQTSGLAPVSTTAPVPQAVGASLIAGHRLRGPLGGWRERIAFALNGSALLQPRLAMTTAMAFFSIAVTMSITGVHLHGSDLTPSGVRRAFYQANARVVQYYEGLRVVYELESRVHDLESEPDAGATPQPSAPAAQPASPAPGSGTPPDGTGRPAPSGNSSPETPGPGSSRRESLFPRVHVVATLSNAPTQVKKEGPLV